jgi:hypothetical protein
MHLNTGVCQYFSTKRNLYKISEGVVEKIDPSEANYA